MVELRVCRVVLYSIVCNNIYSKMFIFGSIMTKMNKNGHFFKVVGYDYKRFRLVPKHLRRTVANFHGSIGWFSAQNRLAHTFKIVKRSSVGK